MTTANLLDKTALLTPTPPWANITPSHSDLPRAQDLDRRRGATPSFRRPSTPSRVRACPVVPFFRGWNMTAISRRRFMVGAGGGLAVLSLARLNAPSLAFAQDATKATLQMGWIANVENAGEFMAAENGYYAAEGLDMTLEPGGPAVSVEPLVVAGKALVGLSQPDIVARARQNGAKLKVVAATFQRNPAAVMSLASAPINTPQELVGKKLGIQQSGVPIYDAFFTSIGIDPKSITYVPVQFDPAPLVNGEVDAFASFQTNQPIQLKTQGIDTVTFLPADYGFNLYSDAFEVSEDTLADADKRATVVKILRATIKGWQAAIDDPAKAAQVVVDKYGKALNLPLDAQTLTMQAQIPLIQTDETKQNGLLTMSETGIAQNIETLKNTGIDTTADEIFDTSLIEEATAGLATPSA
jgi:ABC-type nitrate/sulfonate/bicarbonate transport system substrate-binding protein